MNLNERLSKLGISIPEIMIPVNTVKPEYWSVIACDQFTSEKQYWEETQHIVGDHPSTLNLILPECYLNEGSIDQKVKKIYSAMKESISSGILRPLPRGIIFVERSTPFVGQRRGLVLALDLEKYDFSKKSTSLARPTEGTIQERLPSRIAVRRNAPLDLSHTILLIDDPDDVVMITASNHAEKETLYDFDLIQRGGHLTGRLVLDLENLTQAIESIARNTDFLFAVGDGNHSLASAKKIWEEKKSAGAPVDHPTRFALVEVVNIHDEGLHFHPIHRLLYNADTGRLITFLKDRLSLSESRINRFGQDFVTIMIISENKEMTFTLNNTTMEKLTIELIQEALNSYIDTHPEIDIDYIHGEKSLRELADKSGTVGILLPNPDKKTFFSRISQVGPYPGKSFSIGEAVEKRYYMESRLLD